MCFSRPKTKSGYLVLWYRSGNFQMSAQQYWFLTVGGEVQQVKSGVISQEGNQVCVFLSHGTMNPKISENHDLDSSDCIHFTDRSHMTQNCWPQKLQKWHGFSFGSRKKCPTNSRFQKETPFYVAMAIYRTSDRSQHPKVDGWGQPQHLSEYVHVFSSPICG